MLTAVCATSKATRQRLFGSILLLAAISSLGLAGCSGVVKGQQATTTPGSTTPGATAVTISSVQASSATTSGFQVSWTTSVGATSAIDYGTTAAYGASTATNSMMVTSHQMAVTGLAAGKLYHYRARSTDANNNTATSGDQTFSTTGGSGNPPSNPPTGNPTPPDTTPPTISITAPGAGATVTGTITISASASDNVGVASVQFKVDGASVGTLDTATPYTTSWNSTSVGNGPHVLTAEASDAAGNTATSVGVTVTVSNTAGSVTPDQDFANRCAATGVIKCVTFDTNSDIPGGVSVDDLANPFGLDSADAAAVNNAPVIDNTVSASGGGSLRFTIPSSLDTDTAGAWFTNFSNDYGTQFGPGQDFYIQWRQRWDPPAISQDYTTAGSQGWKQIIVGEGNTAASAPASNNYPGHVAWACSPMEIVLQNYNMRGHVEAYHSCGDKLGEYENIYGEVGGEPGVQNAVNCAYPSFANCINYQPNQWMTFQMHVKVSTWFDGTHFHDDGVFQLWIAFEGQPAVLAIDTQNANFTMDHGPGYDYVNCCNDWNGTVDPVARYGKLYLLPYQTGAGGGNFTVAHTWYDELIISKQRVPDPQ